MQDILAALQRALVFLFKPGNLVYWPIPMVVGLVFIFLPIALPASLIMLITLALGLLSACKLLDGATRIMHGLDNEPVPFAPLTVLPLPVAVIVLGATALCGFIFGMLSGILGLSGNITQLILTLVLAFLQPLWLLAVLESNRFTSLFAADELSAALQRIGTERYLLAVGLPIAGAAVFAIVAGFLGQIGAWVGMFIIALAGALAAVTWAYFVESDESADTDFADINLDNMDFSDIVMDDSLLAAMDEGRADDIPEGEIVPISREKAEQQRAASGGLFSRLRKKDTDVPTETFASADDSQLTAPSAQPARQPAKAEKKTVLPDLSLLAGTDAQHLELEEQILFARDLMDADALWQNGNLQGAEAILSAYAGEDMRIATYFPVFKRLDRIYRQQGREDERHALHTRMLAAAAEENYQPAYHFAHTYVPQHEASAFPADWIFPLAQYAAAEGHYDNVLHLTRNFARNHPEHAQIVDNYFLAARALEKLGNLETARQLLAQLLQRYPEHGKIGQIRAMHDLLVEKINGLS